MLNLVKIILEALVLDRDPTIVALVLVIAVVVSAAYYAGPTVRRWVDKRRLTAHPRDWDEHLEAKCLDREREG